MVVIRHKKGENNLTIYNSSSYETAVSTVELERTKTTSADSTLVFGCAKADDGAYENNAVGNIYWCKIWYGDLGDKVCQDLASWVHESVDLEVCGFKKYYLSQNSSKRCNMTLLATHLLSHARKFNTTNTNAGGWADAYLNEFLNTRMYESMPCQIKAILQQVSVASSVGKQSTEISNSDCYLAIPAIIELSNESAYNKEPYVYEGTTISYMTSTDARKRAYLDGTYASYFTRSPNAGYSAAYIWQINASGEPYGFTGANNNAGVLLEISF